MDFDIEDLLRRIPKPSYDELPGLYNELDEMARKISDILTKSRFYDRSTGLVHFERLSEEELLNLIQSSPNELVPLFVAFCGLSVRELKPYNIEDVYELRKKFDKDKAKLLAAIIKGLLNAPFGIETIIYKFYKNWEEHQKRHYRARIEESVRQFFRNHGYRCEKLTRPIELDGAIPPEDPKVILQIRLGVMKDLVKRAKEFSAEFDNARRFFPYAHFVPVYIPREHELKNREVIREIIMRERRGKESYEIVIVSMDELEKLLPKLEEWKVPKNYRITDFLSQ